ncbi:hypothetical protein B0H14DRAFT_3522349 [Mycena olivaceomarginata]|nr:hypothetical protein B0H14DRAFT_3522349 [Mycena olivaceomarginata]
MDPSLSLEDVYASYAMEDMKPSYLCEECCAAAEPCEFIAWGRSCQRCQFHVYGTCTFRDQTYFDTFRFSTNRQGDGPHDLRLSQIKASLARITDLNVLKEHLLICERGNWADEVTTMIVERQIEIMHPAPQRSCVECTLQLSPTCEYASLSWFFATHRKELSAFSALAANKPDFAKAVKWDKWNQLMPYAQEIVSKQVYEEFASFAQAYHHVLSKLSVNILQDIRIIVVANTTSLSLLRTVD